ncbi:hypothetical protein Plec18167_005119 [Paecilomyces lecythidis]|uniref:Uncharacterized protein n=1 Tax=Paecilomyces lecythidis TaxID=3004212 RepID=A0ABR3XL57_9EURO
MVVPLRDMEDLRHMKGVMVHGISSTPSNNMARHRRSFFRNNTIHIVHRRRMVDSKTSMLQNHYLSSQITSQADLDPASFLVSAETSQKFRQKKSNHTLTIPEVGHKRFSDENMTPFVRVRVPEMEQNYGISHHEWIVFLDEFNEAWMANPALQAANQAGNIAGMAPSVIAQIVGVGVNVTAGIGSAVTTKVRTKKYLAKANEEVFGPKGLHVQVCKTEKMLEYVGLSGQDNVFSRYKQAFEYTQMNAPMVQGNNNPTLQRMQSLGSRVMMISFDNVEASTKPEGWMKKWGAHEAQKAEQKQNEKNAREQRRADRRSGRGSSRRQERQEKKKEKETKKIRWLVIVPKEQVAGKDEDWDSESEESGKSEKLI